MLQDQLTTMFDLFRFPSYLEESFFSGESIALRLMTETVTKGDHDDLYDGSSYAIAGCY